MQLSSFTVKSFKNMCLVQSCSIFYHVSPCSNTLYTHQLYMLVIGNLMALSVNRVQLNTDIVVCQQSAQVCLWTVESTLASLFTGNNGSRLVWREALLGGQRLATVSSLGDSRPALLLWWYYHTQGYVDTKGDKLKQSVMCSSSCGELI